MEERSRRGPYFRRCLDFIAGLSFGYGTRPDYPFIWSLTLILLFGLAWRHLNKKDYDDYSFSDTTYSMKANDESSWPKFQSILAELEPFSFSAVVFLSGARFLIDAPEIPDMPRRSKQLAKYIFDLERILGAVFMSLFLYTISRTIIRAA